MNDVFTLGSIFTLVRDEGVYNPPLQLVRNCSPIRLSNTPIVGAGSPPPGDVAKTQPAPKGFPGGFAPLFHTIQKPGNAGANRPFDHGDCKINVGSKRPISFFAPTVDKWLASL